MRVWALLTIVVISTGLAGCAKGSAEELTGPVGTNNVQASGEALADAGSIEGMVVDDTLLPLPGASVGLEGIEGVATTNEAGAFSFTNLAPGPYTVHAARLGYDSKSGRVEVLAGQPTPVQITLQPIAIPETVYVEMIIHGLHMACGEGLIVVTVTGGPCQAFGDNVVTADVNVTADLLSLVAELEWVRNSGFSSPEMRLTAGINETVTGGLTSFGTEYVDEQGPSPVVGRADAPFKNLEHLAEEDSFIRFRTWVPGQSDQPPIVVLVIDQRFTLYTSMFYGEPAAAEFSAIPDA